MTRVMADVDQVCFWVCVLVLPSDSYDVAFYEKFGIDATWWRRMVCYV